MLQSHPDLDTDHVGKEKTKKKTKKNLLGKLVWAVAWYISVQDLWNKLKKKLFSSGPFARFVQILPKGTRMASQFL